jgi:DNA-binding NarL/FixJ family response regulator
MPYRFWGLLDSCLAAIVGFLAQGLSNKHIARQLGIMEDTVKKHLQSIFSKLGVRRRTLVALRQVGRQ